MEPKSKTINWSPEIAYAVGLIATDGNLSPDGRHLCLVSKDVFLLSAFKKCLGLKNKIGLRKGGYVRNKTYYCVQFGNVRFYKWLLSIGLMPNKTKRMESLKVPRKYFFDFLRGHLDGDGYIRKYQDPIYPNSQRLYIKFHSASLEHIYWLQRKIKLLLGINGFIENKKREFALSFAKKDSLLLLSRLYPNNTVPCLERKRKIVECFLK